VTPNAIVFANKPKSQVPAVCTVRGGYCRAWWVLQKGDFYMISTPVKPLTPSSCIQTENRSQTLQRQKQPKMQQAFNIEKKIAKII
jgi:hypothetical protein